MSEVTIKAKDHVAYSQLTIISVIVPLVGIVAGIVYLTKPEAGDRKLGEHLLAVGLLAAILWYALWVVVIGNFFSTPTIYVPITQSM